MEVVSYETIYDDKAIWCTDLTYIRMPGGFVYLVAVMDWYSRQVLSWELSITVDESFCVKTLK